MGHDRPCCRLRHSLNVCVLRRERCIPRASLLAEASDQLKSVNATATASVSSGNETGFEPRQMMRTSGCSDRRSRTRPSAGPRWAAPRTNRLARAPRGSPRERRSSQRDFHSPGSPRRPGSRQRRNRRLIRHRRTRDRTWARPIPASPIAVHLSCRLHRHRAAEPVFEPGQADAASLKRVLDADAQHSRATPVLWAPAPS
jgi:hypothetical protein